MNLIDILRSEIPWLVILGGLVAVLGRYGVVRLRENFSKRAAAKAYWAELVACGTNLSGQAMTLRSSPVRMAQLLPLRTIDTPVFKQSPELLGKLDSSTATKILTLYKMIEEVDTKHRELKSSTRARGVDDEWPSNHAQWLRHLGLTAYDLAAELRVQAGVNQAEHHSVTAAHRKKPGE